MRSPAETVRVALEQWLREQATECVQRWRGDAQALSPRRIAERHAWLASDDAVREVHQAADEHLLEPQEQGALLAHLARARRESELAEVHEGLAALAKRTLSPEGEPVEARTLLERLPHLGAGGRAAAARALEALADEALPWLLDARARADERVAGGDDLEVPHPDCGDLDEVALRARKVLEATDGLASDLVGAALRRIGIPRGGGWHDLAAALRGPQLDRMVPRRDRWRRVTAELAKLGYERDMTARMRAEADHAGLDPRARAVAVDAPRDVRVAASPLELGVGSELAAADVAGRALGLCLAAPALPVAFRWPVEGTCARALGTLLVQLPLESQALRRSRGLAEQEVQRLVPLGATWLLLETRVQAAATLVAADMPDASASGERIDRATEHLTRALQVDLPRSLAGLIAVAPSGAVTRFRARAAGLALWVALREHFDEDWYRNPRSAEPLRAGCNRGGRLSAERWCDELGASPDDAPTRLREWFDG